MKSITRLSLILLCLIMLSSCSPSPVREISCEELCDAYRAAGYTVWHKEATKEDPQCQIRASVPEEESRYIYFTVFETAEEAAAHAKESDGNALISFFILLFGGNGDLHADSYGRISYQCDDRRLLQPFEALK